MTNEKLRRLGLDLPLFPTTTVGSLPKPDYIKDARRQFARGEMGAAELEELEKKAVAFWIQTQEELGIDILVDGEVYRGDMVTYFAERMDGFEIGGFVRSYGNRYYRKPIITGEIRWRQPNTIEWWSYAQGLTEKPVKGILTGPYTMMDWCFIEHYSTRKAAAMALAKELRKEVKALIKAGAKIIQVDEPAISAQPAELEVAREALQIVTEGLDAYFISHICFGNFETVYPGMLELPVDNLDLEMSNSELNLIDPLRAHPFTKALSFGSLDVHSHVVEAEHEIESRLRMILEVISPDQLWIDPDCGLKTRTVEETKAKLANMTSVVRRLRTEYESASGSRAT